MSIAVLGEIVFEVNADKVFTWIDVKRAGTSRWATHEVFAGKPKKEFIGPGLDKITMSVRLDISRGVVPKDELQRMRDARNAGTVMQFTVGGSLVGQFAIEDLQETWRHMSGAGVLLVAVADLTLEEYA